MKNLFEAATLAEVKQRMAELTPESRPQWGSMNAAQALAHCGIALSMAAGELTPPRALLGRIFGRTAINSMFRGKPMAHNAPGHPSAVVADERDLAIERQNLIDRLDRFQAGGPAGCTRQPHFFFGKLSPEEWAAFQYIHLDHHLRQFGV